MSHNIAYPLLQRRRQYIVTGVSVGGANTDAATFTGLPAKYRVMQLMAFESSANISIVTAGLFTASAGGGTALAPTQAVVAASSVISVDFGSLVASYQTAGTLYFRVTTAHLVAATISLMLEVIDLS